MPFKSFQCDDWYQLLVVVVGYALTMLLSGFVNRLFVGKPHPGTSSSEHPEPTRAEDVSTETKNEGERQQPEDIAESAADTSEVRKVVRSGALIGKCENFLALTFVLSGQLTALALVFTAKSIVRLDVIKKDPQYYLGGTLVNLCFSILMGYLIRFLLP